MNFDINDFMEYLYVTDQLDNDDKSNNDLEEQYEEIIDNSKQKTLTKEKNTF